MITRQEIGSLQGHVEVLTLSTEALGRKKDMTSWASEGSQEAVWRGISLGRVPEAGGRFLWWSGMGDEPGGEGDSWEA